MNKLHSNRHLVWKEARQTLPLLAVLLALGALLLLIWVAFGNYWQRSEHFSMLFALPVFFAIGAGAVLIGQEKDLRTLDWLRTLPVTPQQAIATKLVTGLAGLASVWMASFGLWCLAHQVFADGFHAATMELFGPPVYEAAFLPVHSLYLLLVGYWIASRLRFSLMVLLLMAPAAFVPSMITLLLVGDAKSSTALATSIALHLLFACATLMLAWRAGIRCMSAAETFPASAPTTKSRRSERSTRIHTTPYSRASALIWQFVRQNLWPLSGITAGLACFTAAAVVLTVWGARPNQEPMMILVIVGLLASSWLGTLALVGDRTQNRIQFLADRGVSARLSWWTRQVVPFAVLVVVCAGPLVLAGFQDGYWLGDPIAPMFAAASCVAYVAAQWFAQVIPSPIIAAIGGPPFAAASIGYFGFLLLRIGTPLWLLVAVASLPLMATYFLMGRWMDGRLDRGFWLGHLACLLAVAIVPFVPLWALMLQPGLPTETERAIADTIRHGDMPGVAIGLNFWWDVRLPNTREGEPGTKSDFNDLTERGKRVESDPLVIMDDLLRQLRDSSSAREANQRISIFLTSQATLAKWRLLKHTDPADAELFQKAVEVIVAYTGRLRQSGSIADQDTADLHEIWLLRELQEPEARNLLSQTVLNAATTMLRDSSLRRRARQRAVAWSWQAWQRQRGLTDSIGGYVLDYGMPMASIQRAKQSPRLGTMFADLWELASKGSAAATTERRRRLAESWNVPASLYGIGELGKYYRADAPTVWLLEFDKWAPAMQWGAGWEEMAANLDIAGPVVADADVGTSVEAPHVPPKEED